MNIILTSGTLKKIFFWFISLIAGLILILIIIIQVFKDDIINEFVSTVNQRLEVPVNTDEIDVTLFGDFPNISISLSNVFCEGKPNYSQNLIRADRILVNIGLFEIFSGEVSVKSIIIQEGEVNIERNADNSYNFQIWKEDTTKENTQTTFNIDKIFVDHVLISFYDNARSAMYQANTLFAEVDLVLKPDQKFMVDGNFIWEKIIEPTYKLDKSIPVNIETEITYLADQKTVNWKNGLLEMDGFNYLTSGSYIWEGEPKTEVLVSSKKTNVKHILQFIPGEQAEPWLKYQSSGNLSFQAEVKGKADLYSMLINFRGDNFNITYPETGSKFKNASMEGSFTSSNIDLKSTYSLKISALSGQFGSDKVTGYVNLVNFVSPIIDCSLKGSADLKLLTAFLPGEDIVAKNGKVHFDFSLNGRLEDMKSQKFENSKANGEIQIQNTRFNVKGFQYDFQNFQGNFRLKDNQLAISDLKGEIGSSDIRLNGFADYIFSLFSSDNKQQISIESDLFSKNLNLDELLSGNLNTVKGQEYSLHLPEKINLDFDCKVEKINFRRFSATNLTGNLIIKNKVANIKDLRLNSFGGYLELNAQIDDRYKSGIIIDNRGRVNNINIDEVFYVFENFGQTWLQDKHLQGQITAYVSSHIVLDPSLKFLSDYFTCRADIQIKNGELNNFEPLQDLSKFVKEESLANLRFDDLQNELVIKNRQITLPKMTVGTNVTTLDVSGTHTFNQEINYQVIVPLSRAKQDKDEVFGAVEDDGTGSPNLYLRIVGTTDEYDIIYDTRAVSKKIVTDIKSEKKELIDAFKHKGVDQDKTVELSDEYFDFPEDTTNNKADN
ncbi:DUF3971 domain-containing protein [Mangrovivirga sp. M17]|uniref:DUF3971 domain-containing protein n=1 Tax=Mangrovivirga halotolerans TaxID=2993936 RepID=A0ABT3RVU3_9BACT|nr:AsmA-like C-terminal region-containing protein [Mangrovivirga halotolerans]MCX2745894.1 DUF3971 domain-containing protein [Mangrovivirga halotolerans]